LLCLVAHLLLRAEWTSVSKWCASLKCSGQNVEVKGEVNRGTGHVTSGSVTGYFKWSGKRGGSCCNSALDIGFCVFACVLLRCQFLAGCFLCSNIAGSSCRSFM
jgi:hypothetical protein